MHITVISFEFENGSNNLACQWSRNPIRLELTFNIHMDHPALSAMCSSFTAVASRLLSQAVIVFLVPCSGDFVGVKTYVGLRQTKLPQLLGCAMIHVLCFSAQRLVGSSLFCFVTFLISVTFFFCVLM